MMKRWLAVLMVLAMAQTASAEPIRVAKANFKTTRKPAAAAVPAVPAPASEPLTINVADERILKDAVRGEMMEFIQRNYPSHVQQAVRSLQNGEGMMHEELADSMRFLKEFAGGPVTIEGASKEVRGALRYVVTGTIHGVNGHPEATLKFETSPGFIRPVTQVTVDDNGDGQTDEKSSAFCRLDRMRDWVEKRYPQDSKEKLTS